jgi:hypothetical protein
MTGMVRSTMTASIDPGWPAGFAVRQGVVGLQDLVVEISQMGAEGTADGGFVIDEQMAMS